MSKVYIIYNVNVFPTIYSSSFLHITQYIIPNHELSYHFNFLQYIVTLKLTSIGPLILPFVLRFSMEKAQIVPLSTTPWYYSRTASPTMNC